LERPGQGQFSSWNRRHSSGKARESNWNKVSFAGRPGAFGGNLNLNVLRGDRNWV